jgi:hypothetical protein
MAASSSKNLPEHSGKLGFGAINSREEAKIFRLRSSENVHNRFLTIPALLSMLIKQADIFQTTFYSRQTSNGSINKKLDAIGANINTPLQNSILSLK